MPKAIASASESVAAAEKEALTELCHAHGFDIADIEKRAKKIKFIDLFEAKDVDGSAFTQFTEVVEISVIHAQKLSKMYGFNSINLTRLFLVECGISKIENLQHCPNLTVLNLDGNRLTQIQGLQTCKNLESLWLNNNKISEISGLDACVALKELHLSRNRIRHVGHGLANLAQLEILNLSDNFLESFREIGFLSGLSSLIDLTFSDPHWGENPMVGLCNYATYVLYQLPRLQRLDGMIVTTDAKSNAESTFLKKRMYYSMRSKTLRRNLANFIGTAAMTTTVLRHALMASTVALIIKRSELEAQLLRNGYSIADDGKRDEGAGATGGASKYAELAKVEAAIAARQSTLQQLQQGVTHLQSSADKLLAAHMKRMELELFSGGNVRLEEGRPSLLLSLEQGAQPTSSQADPWFSSVTDLLRSRFSARDYAALRIAGIRITRVLRIHNRGLRARFEKRISQIFSSQPALAAALNALSGESSTPSSPKKKGGSGDSTPKETAGKPTMANKKGIEYVIYTSPWTRDSVENQLHDGRDLASLSTSPQAIAINPDACLASDLAPNIRRIAEHGFTAEDATIAVKAPALSHEDCVAILPTYAAPDATFGPAAARQKPVTAVSPVASSTLLPTAGPGTSFAIPVSPSLSCADFPRLSEAFAATIATSGEEAARKSSSNSSVKALNALTAGSAATATVKEWLRSAGIDQADISMQARIQAVTGQPDQFPSLKRGSAVISKCFSGNCLALDTKKTTLSLAPDEVKVAAENAISAGLLGAAATAVHSVSVCRPDDQRQKLLAFLDPSLLLPEYIVEFEYVFEGEEDAAAPPELPEPSAAIDASLLAELRNELSEVSQAAHIKQAEEVTRTALPCTRRFDHLFQVFNLLKKGRIAAGLHASLLRECVAALSMYSADEVKSCLRQHLFFPLEAGPTDVPKLILQGFPRSVLSSQEECDIRPFSLIAASFTSVATNLLKQMRLLIPAGAKSTAEFPARVMDFQAWQLIMSAGHLRLLERDRAGMSDWQSAMSEFGSQLILRQATKKPCDAPLTVAHCSPRVRLAGTTWIVLSDMGMNNFGEQWAKELDGLVGRHSPFSIMELRLTNSGIIDGSLPTLSAMCPLVEIVDVSCNALTSLAPFKGLSRLTKLDASWNSIGNLWDSRSGGSALEGCSSLVDLELSGNRIQKLSDISSIFASCRGLRSLNLQWNPLTHPPFIPPNFMITSLFAPFAAVKLLVLQQLPALQVFGGVKVSISEREAADAALFGDFASPLQAALSTFVSPVEASTSCFRAAGHKCSTDLAYPLWVGDAISRLAVQGGLSESMPVLLSTAAESRLKELDSTFPAFDDVTDKVGMDFSGQNYGGTTLFSRCSLEHFRHHVQLRSLQLDSNPVLSLVLPLPSSSAQYSSEEAWKEAFTLTGLPSLANVHLSSLCSLKQLQSLSLHNCKLLALAYQHPDAWDSALALAPSPTSRPVALPLQYWLSPLTALSSLEKLDLSNNLLTDEALSAAKLHLLPQLHQLCLENNRLTSFAGFRGCRSLMELYCSNNLIAAESPKHIEEKPQTSDKSTALLHTNANLRMLQSLRPEYFPRLIIADFSGNPICSEKSYREYAIYHVRRLKVLDGVGVSSEESAAVRERYSGRVTLDFLEERVASGACNGGIPASILEAAGSGMILGDDESPHHMGRQVPLDFSVVEVTTVYAALRELDLTACKIKEIDTLPGSLFGSLKTVILDHNQLTSEALKGLQQLPAVQVLSMNHNRITSVLPALGYEDTRSGSRKGMGPPPSIRIGSSNLTSIEVLNLSHNNISDMELLGLDLLPKLKILDLSNNEIVRVCGLQNATALTQLNLEGNSIRALDPDSLTACAQLVELRLGDNGLKTLLYLDGCTRLQALSVASNRITELVELDVLIGLGMLQEVSLVNNPVSRKPGYRHAAIMKLAQLIFLDGREITMDERQRVDYALSTLSMATPQSAIMGGIPGAPPGGVAPVTPSGTPAGAPAVVSVQAPIGQPVMYMPLTTTQLMQVPGFTTHGSAHSGGSTAGASPAVIAGISTLQLAVPTGYVPEKRSGATGSKIPAGGIQGSYGLMKYNMDGTILQPTAGAPGGAPSNSLAVMGMNIVSGPPLSGPGPARQASPSAPPSSGGLGVPAIPAFGAMSSLLLRGQGTQKPGTSRPAR